MAKTPKTNDAVGAEENKGSLLTQGLWDSGLLDNPNAHTLRVEESDNQTYSKEEMI